MKLYTFYGSAFIVVLCIGHGKGKFILADKDSYSNDSFVSDDISKERFLIWSQLASNLSVKNIPLEYNKD